MTCKINLIDMKYLIVALFLSVAYVNLSFAQTKSDSTALHLQFQRQAEAYQQEDAKTLAKLYTKNAVMLPPGAPPISGRETIRKLFVKQFASINAAVEFTTLEVMIADNWAYRWGTYTVTIKTPNQKKISITDKFIDIWKKGSDGVWRIHRDIWNHNMPLSVIKKKVNGTKNNK